MHDHHERFGHFSPHSRGGGRHRARRGAIVEAVLTLLDERPMHGYELITELETRSDGRWRPSAGTMYPALGRMEDKGLLVSSDVDGKKQFSLSDVGQERLAALRAERPDDAPEPWDEHAGGGRGDLRRRIQEIVGQARQIGRFGTTEQIAAAGEVLDDTRRRLYKILADDTGTNSSHDADAIAPEPGD